MQISSDRHGSVQIIRLGMSRIDATSAIAFKTRMKTEIDPDAARILLDVGQVTFIDSSGSGALVWVFKQTRDDQDFALSGVNPLVDKVLKLTQIDQFFTFFDRPEDGLSP